MIIAGAKSDKLQFIVNEEELDEILYVMRKTSVEKSSHIINFSVKKDINVGNFYSFLISSLFQSKYVGHLSEELTEMMIPTNYETEEDLFKKYPKIAQKYPNPLIKYRIQ